MYINVKLGFYYHALDHINVTETNQNMDMETGSWGV